MKAAPRRRRSGFIKFDHEFVDTAIEPLTCGATRHLVGLMRQFNGYNNGEIVFSIRQASAWCRCGKDAAAAYLRELQDRGLVVPMVKGHFRTKSETGKRVASTWRLPFLEQGAEA